MFEFRSKLIQFNIWFNIISWKFNSKDYSIQNQLLWFNSMKYSIKNNSSWFNSIDYSIQKAYNGHFRRFETPVTPWFNMNLTNVTTPSNPEMAWRFMLENPTRKLTQLWQHLVNSGTSQGAQWASLHPPFWTPAGRGCEENLTLSVVPVTLNALMERHWGYTEAVFTSSPGSVLTVT